MADISFPCPGCNQQITCDELWGGHQLQCPSCQTNLIVPQTEAAPPPPPPPPRPATHSRPASAPSRPSPAQRRPVKQESKGGGGMMAVKILVGVAVFGVAFYFAFNWARNMQSSVNEKSEKAVKESDGGQVGHIADLYSVLDATDPNRFSRDYESSTPRIPRRSTDGGDGGDDAGETEKPLPVIPPVWTMDVMTAKIPEGRVNGSISGTNFVVDVARLDVVGNATVLSLRQGTNVSPDRELLVYLHPKPGEKVAGGSWAVAKEMKGLAVPQVAKRWKPNPKYAATTKSFSSGYTMRLELGQISDGEVRGKIYVALPDTEQSVVGGIFNARTSLEDTTNLFRTRIRMDDSDF